MADGVVNYRDTVREMMRDLKEGKVVSTQNEAAKPPPEAVVAQPDSIELNEADLLDDILDLEEGVGTPIGEQEAEELLKLSDDEGDNDKTIEAEKTITSTEQGQNGAEKQEEKEEVNSEDEKEMMSKEEVNSEAEKEKMNKDEINSEAEKEKMNKDEINSEAEEEKMNKEEVNSEAEKQKMNKEEVNSEAEKHEEEAKKDEANSEAEKDEPKESSKEEMISDDEDKISKKKDTTADFKDSDDSNSIQMVEDSSNSVLSREGDDEDEVTTEDSDKAKAAPLKMASKKSEEVEVVELSSEEEDESSEEDDEEEEEEDEVGHPERPPGEGASRPIPPDHLMPFHHGWRREVVWRTRTSNQTASQCDIYYIPPQEGRYRTREAKRKRRSKADQERYFQEFPDQLLSTINFNYVRRPLGLNNAAYEIVRKPRKTVVFKPAPSSKGGSKKRRTTDYKEVEESAGLLEDDSSDEEELLSLVNGFDVDMPISLQIGQSVMGLQAEHKKRKRKRDPETCCTPPLAEDSLWTNLDDDPLGVFNHLGGRSSPTTPPPLRALKLTPKETAEKIEKAIGDVKGEAAKLDDTFLQKPLLEDDLISHDVAIKKFKNYKSFMQKFPTCSSINPTPFRSGRGGMPNFAMRPGISISGGNPFKPCTQQCPGSQGIIPSLQCMSCKCLYHAKCQRVSSQQHTFVCRSCVAKANQNSPSKSVKLRLPMLPVNGRRPVVEMVMQTSAGKFQPIKFANNSQVTETIPRAMFERANSLRKTVYQRAMQVTRVGDRPIYLAINPSNNSHQKRPMQQRQPLQQQQRTAAPPALPGDQVSILVKPRSQGPNGKPVLLNVPRRVALKVKVGTTLSFSASNDHKYTVMDNKIHPPVGSSTKGGKSGPQQQMVPSRRPPLPLPQMMQRGGGGGGRPLAGSSGQNRLPLVNNLPKSLSIQRTSSAVSRATYSNNRRRPLGSAISMTRAPPKLAPRPLPGSNVLASGEVVSGTSSAAMTPCTPYCPGVTGFPELECCNCQSLFHSKCVGIPESAVGRLKNTFKCRMCAPTKTGNRRSHNAPVQVIDLD